MEDFISVIATKIGTVTTDLEGNLKIKSGCAHNVATYFFKLRVDKENDVYYDRSLGAVVGNVDLPITSIDELENFKNKKTKVNPYQKFLDMRDKGYNLVVGRPFPGQHGGASSTSRGIYCKNYLEIAKKEKEEENLRKQRLKNLFKNDDEFTI